MLYSLNFTTFWLECEFIYVEVWNLRLLERYLLFLKRNYKEKATVMVPNWRWLWYNSWPCCNKVGVGTLKEQSIFVALCRICSTVHWLQIVQMVSSTKRLGLGMVNIPPHFACFSIRVTIHHVPQLIILYKAGFLPLMVWPLSQICSSLSSE